MSKDAGLDLFKAVRALLIGDATINAAVEGRVFSSWGNVADAPLIRMSLGLALPFEMDTPDGSASGSETPISVHIFCKEAAPIQSRTLAAQVREILQDADPDLDGSHTVSFEYENTVQLQDPDDPALQMAVVRFNALTTAK